MKVDTIGITRAVLPWNTPDSYEKRLKGQTANFEKEFSDAVKEYPV